MTDRELMQMALDALITAELDGNCEYGATEALRARLAQPEQEPVACDGNFPEGFSASSGIPAQALRAANAIMCDVIGERNWDVPCTAKHLLAFAYSYTARLAQPEQSQIVWIDNKQTGNFLNMAPPQRGWQGLTDEEIDETAWPYFIGNIMPSVKLIVRQLEAKLRERNQ